MATSGVASYWPEIQDIIEEAYERAGYDVHTLASGSIVTARRSMQFIFSDWSTRGVKIWTLAEAEQPLEEGQKELTLASDVLDVVEALRRRSGSDVPMQRISRSELFETAQKSQQGQPDRYWVDRTDPFSRKVRFWPAASETSAGNDTIVYWYMRRLDDPAAGSQNADIPYEAWDALAAELAYRLHCKKADADKSDTRSAELRVLSDIAFRNMAASVRDRGATFIVPMWRYWGTR